MLKKITLAAVGTVFLSAVALTGYAQVKVSGEVTAYTTNTTVKDESVSKDSLTTMKLFEVETGVYFSYSEEVLSGWTATAKFGYWSDSRGTDPIYGGTDGNFDGDGNWGIVLENDMLALSFGTYKFLSGVPNSNKSWKVKYIGGTALDAGDVSGREGAVGFSLKSVPNLTLKAGFGTSSKQSDVTKSSTDTTQVAADNNFSQFGVYVGYDVAGVSLGLQFSQKDWKKAGEYKDDDEVKTSENVVAVGVDYDVASVASNVPLNVYFNYFMKNTKDAKEKLIGGSYSTMAFGTNYNYGSGNVGLFYEAATYAKEGHLNNGDAAMTKFDDAQVNTGLALYADYMLGASTTLFGSYSSTNSEKGALGDNKNSTTKVAFGLDQSF